MFTELAAANSAHLLTDMEKCEARAAPPPDDFLLKYKKYIKPTTEHTIQGEINATPQLLTELKKYNITNHRKLFELDSVITPWAQPRPNYFHFWTRGSLVTETAKMRPQIKAQPQCEYIHHHHRTQPEDLPHDKRDAPTDTKKIAPRHRVHAGRSKVGCFALGPLHARGKKTRLAKHAEREAFDRRARNDTLWS
jgi:hypothetical protein